MKNLIRSLLLVFLSFGFLAPNLSHAGDELSLGLNLKDAKDLKTFRGDFENVIYSLEHFDDLVKGLDNNISNATDSEGRPALKMSTTYSNANFDDVVDDINRIDQISEGTAFSKKTFMDMKNRLSTAVDLLTVLVQDKDLPTEEWEEKVVRLYGALDGVMFSIIRYHGEDKIDRESGKIPPHKVVGGIFKELLMDAKNIFTLRRAANGELVYGPFDRARRNKLSIEYLGKLNQFIDQAVAKLDKNEPVRLMLQEQMQQMASMGIDIRKNRITAQWTTAATYFGFALWGFFMPHVDAIGMIAGRSEMSLDFSADIYAAFWATIFLAKLSTVSGKVLTALKEIIANAKDPEMFGMGTGKKPTLRERMTSLSKSIQHQFSKGNSSVGLCIEAINRPAIAN